MTVDLSFGSGSPEGVLSREQGSLYSETGSNTTLWRKTVDDVASDDMLDWIRSDLNVYNIRDFGALCNGVDDDWDAWDAAIAAAESDPDNVGVVFHPGGISPIRQTLLTNADKYVQFIGGPSAVIQAIENFESGSPMLFISQTPGLGNRYGAVRDLRFDGAGHADIGIWVLAVQRQFENVSVRFCRKIGLYVPGAQNCTFISCQFEENGGSQALDCNCMLDGGAGNNTFFGCQFNVSDTETDRGTYHLIMTQSAEESPGGAFDVPTLNSFFGCQFERSSGQHAGAIYQNAGLSNSFHSCTINTSGERVAVTVDRTNAFERNSLSLRLNSCSLSGTRTFDPNLGSTAILARGLEDHRDGPAVIVSNLHAENFNKGFVVDDWTGVDVIEPMYIGSVTTPFDNYSSDNNTVSSLINQRTLQLPGPPTDDAPNGQPINHQWSTPWFFDDTNKLLHFWSRALGVDYWRSIPTTRKTIGTWAAVDTGSIEIDSAEFNYFRITDTTGSKSFTISDPENAYVGRRLTIDIYNSSGNAGSGTITPGGVYKFTGSSFAKPNSTLHNLYSFEFDGSFWRQVCQQLGQPN